MIADGREYRVPRELAYEAQIAAWNYLGYNPRELSVPHPYHTIGSVDVSRSLEFHMHHHHHYFASPSSSFSQTKPVSSNFVDARLSSSSSCQEHVRLCANGGSNRRSSRSNLWLKNHLAEELVSANSISTFAQKASTDSQLFEGGRPPRRDSELEIKSIEYPRDLEWLHWNVYKQLTLLAADEVVDCTRSVSPNRQSDTTSSRTPQTAKMLLDNDGTSLYEEILHRKSKIQSVRGDEPEDKVKFSPSETSESTRLSGKTSISVESDTLSTKVIANPGVMREQTPNGLLAEYRITHESDGCERTPSHSVFGLQTTPGPVCDWAGGSEGAKEQRSKNYERSLFLGFGKQVCRNEGKDEHSIRNITQGTRSAKCLDHNKEKTRKIKKYKRGGSDRVSSHQHRRGEDYRNNTEKLKSAYLQDCVWSMSLSDSEWRKKFRENKLPSFRDVVVTAWRTNLESCDNQYGVGTYTNNALSTLEADEIAQGDLSRPQDPLTVSGKGVNDISTSMLATRQKEPQSARTATRCEEDSNKDFTEKQQILHVLLEGCKYMSATEIGDGGRDLPLEEQLTESKGSHGTDNPFTHPFESLQTETQNPEPDGDFELQTEDFKSPSLGPELAGTKKTMCPAVSNQIDGNKFSASVDFLHPCVHENQITERGTSIGVTKVFSVHRDSSALPDKTSLSQKVDVPTHPLNKPNCSERSEFTLLQENHDKNMHTRVRSHISRRRPRRPKQQSATTFPENYAEREVFSLPDSRRRALTAEGSNDSSEELNVVVLGEESIGSYRLDDSPGSGSEELDSSRDVRKQSGLGRRRTLLKRWEAEKTVTNFDVRLMQLPMKWKRAAKAEQRRKAQELTWKLAEFAVDELGKRLELLERYKMELQDNLNASRSTKMKDERQHWSEVLPSSFGLLRHSPSHDQTVSNCVQTGEMYMNHANSPQEGDLTSNNNEIRKLKADFAELKNQFYKYGIIQAPRLMKGALLSTSLAPDPSLPCPSATPPTPPKAQNSPCNKFRAFSLERLILDDMRKTATQVLPKLDLKEAEKDGGEAKAKMLSIRPISHGRDNSISYDVLNNMENAIYYRDYFFSKSMPSNCRWSPKEVPKDGLERTSTTTKDIECDESRGGIIPVLECPGNFEKRSTDLNVLAPTKFLEGWCTYSREGGTPWKAVAKFLNAGRVQPLDEIKLAEELNSFAEVRSFYVGILRKMSEQVGDICYELQISSCKDIDYSNSLSSCKEPNEDKRLVDSVRVVRSLEAALEAAEGRLEEEINVNATLINKLDAADQQTLKITENHGKEMIRKEQTLKSMQQLNLKIAKDLSITESGLKEIRETSTSLVAYIESHLKEAEGEVRSLRSMISSFRVDSKRIQNVVSILEQAQQDKDKQIQDLTEQIQVMNQTYQNLAMTLQDERQEKQSECQMLAKQTKILQMEAHETAQYIWSSEIGDQERAIEPEKPSDKLQFFEFEINQRADHVINLEPAEHEKDEKIKELLEQIQTLQRENQNYKSLIGSAEFKRESQSHELIKRTGHLQLEEAQVCKCSVTTGNDKCIHFKLSDWLQDYDTVTPNTLQDSENYDEQRVEVKDELTLNLTTSKLIVEQAQARALDLTREAEKKDLLIQELNSCISIYEQEIAKATNEKLNLVQHNESLARGISTHQQRVAELISINKELIEFAASREEEVKSLTKDVMRLEEGLQVRTDAARELSTEAARCLDELHEAKIKHESYHARCKSLQLKLDETEYELLAREEALDVLAKHLASTIETQDMISEQKEQIKLSLTNAQYKERRTENQMRMIKTLNKDLEEKINTLEEELRQTKLVLDELRVQVNNTLVLEKEAGELRWKVHRLEEEIMEKEGQISILKSSYPCVCESQFSSEDIYR